MRKRWLVTLLVFAVTVACATSRSGVGQSASPPPIIQLRFAQDSPAPGFVRTGWLDREGSVYIADEILLADDGIEQVRISHSPDGLTLCTRMSADAGTRLMAATAQAIGRKLAVLIESRVATVTSIAGPIGGSAVPLLIGVPLRRGSNEELADRITARVTARWPPAPGNSAPCTATVLPNPAPP